MYTSYTFITFTTTTVKILNNMNTTVNLKIADKVKATIARGYKKKAIAEQIGISRPTFDARLRDNCWQFAEIEKMRGLGII